MNSIKRLVWCLLGVWSWTADAAVFDEYVLGPDFLLPESVRVMDVLPDGRIIALAGADVVLESAIGSRMFGHFGTLPDADIASFGPAFLRVSPDGNRIAVGNNGGASFTDFEVGVFQLPSLSGTWLTAAHFDAEWYDQTRLALTAGDFVNPSFVTILDTTSPDPLNPENLLVISNIGGASAGITFDAAGNLYTGNGFQTIGPSATGEIKAFSNAAWLAAMTGLPLNFEIDGTPIVDALSASSLGFDAKTNLLIGGGDFIQPDLDYAALVHASAVQDALTGNGPVDMDDPDLARRLDPDSLNNSNFYSIQANPMTGELYVWDSSTTTVHVYDAVTTPLPAVSPVGVNFSAFALLGIGILILRRRDSARAGGRRTRTSLRTLAPSCLICSGLFLFPIVATPACGADPWADEVVAAHPALNATGLYNNPESVLGPPASVFFDPLLRTQRPVSLLTPAIHRESSEGPALVTTVNTGQFIKVRFNEPVEDDPRNPFGVDFIVFGNSFFVGEDFVHPETDWEDFTLRPAIFAEPVTVSVSPSGIGDPQSSPRDWYSYETGPWADALFPTQALQWNPDRRALEGPLDFTIPVNPAFTEDDFGGRSAAAAVVRYECSGGGTGFDLAESGFAAVHFVYLNGRGGEVDALADVFPSLGDFDRDGDADLADWSQFQLAFDAFIGPYGSCWARSGDWNGSTQLDLNDHNQQLESFTGPL